MALCGDHGKPFAFCLNRENARREVLNSSAEAHLRKLGVILAEHVLDRAVYVSALNKGKTGPEHPDAKQAKEARAEIEALWRAVKSLTEKARAAMTSGKPIDDIDAALADAFGSPEVVALADPRKRRGREKRMSLSADDGRRKRATGRTKQFNCKMRPDLHRQLVQASRASGKSIVVMCEEAFAAYLAALGARAMVRVVAYACLGISGALAAVYGYTTANSEAVGLLRALGWGATAFVGGCCPAWLFAHLDDKAYARAVFTGIVGIVCATVTLSGSIAGISAARATSMQPNEQRWWRARRLIVTRWRRITARARRDDVHSRRRQRWLLQPETRWHPPSDCGSPNAGAENERRGPTAASVRRRNRPSGKHSAPLRPTRPLRSRCSCWMPAQPRSGHVSVARRPCRAPILAPRPSLDCFASRSTTRFHCRPCWVHSRSNSPAWRP